MYYGNSLFKICSPPRWKSSISHENAAGLPSLAVQIPDSGGLQKEQQESEGKEQEPSIEDINLLSPNYPDHPAYKYINFGKR